MKKETYLRISVFWRGQPQRAEVLRKLNRIITRVTYFIYAVLLVILVIWDRAYLLEALVISAVGFAVLSLFRYAFDRERPYERWQLEPLIPQRHSGKSFPSRHVFSIVMVGMVWLPVNPVMSGILFAMGALLAYLRVVSAVHFCRDVIAGAAAAVGWGLLCFGLFSLW